MRRLPGETSSRSSDTRTGTGAGASDHSIARNASAVSGTTVVLSHSVRPGASRATRAANSVGTGRSHGNDASHSAATYRSEKTCADHSMRADLSRATPPPSAIGKTRRLFRTAAHSNRIRGSPLAVASNSSGSQPSARLIDSNSAEIPGSLRAPTINSHDAGKLLPCAASNSNPVTFPAVGLARNSAGLGASETTVVAAVGV